MKHKLSLLCALCALFALLRASDQVIESCRYGLRLCAELIVPSLFPFFVLSLLLSKLGLPALLGQLLAPAAKRLFRVSGAGVTALPVGLCGGYPLGAVYVAELERGGQITAQEGARLLAFCNNSGPAFIVGAVGVGVFGSAALGLRLYAIHCAAALLVGLLLRGFGSDSPSPAVPPAPAPSVSFSRALGEAVEGAVHALLRVCGFAVCFTAFTGLLDANGFFPAAAAFLSGRLGLEAGWCRALLCGLLELGSGAGALRGLPATPLNLALAAGLLGWGGLSVQFQTLAVLSESDIKGALPVAGRLMSAICSVLLALLFFRS